MREQVKVNFNRSNQLGQMSADEREAMYNIVMGCKPKHIFEIGTWMGGGSTYILASALYNLNHGGILHTVESDVFAFDKAIYFYNTYVDLYPLKQHVNFNFGDSTDVYGKLLEDFDSVEMVLFDGADDNQSTLDEWNIFKDKFKSGTIVLCHDWKTKKAEYIKDFLLNEDEWQTIFIMDTETGFSAFKNK